MKTYLSVTYRQRLIDDLELRNYSPCTKKTYVYHVHRFSLWAQSYPSSCGLEEVRNYLKYLLKERKITPHTLRHSFAPHQLEQGTDIRLIQELMGHASPKSTLIYVHVSTKVFRQVRSTLAVLDEQPQV